MSKTTSRTVIATVEASVLTARACQVEAGGKPRFLAYCKTQAGVVRGYGWGKPPAAGSAALVDMVLPTHADGTTSTVIDVVVL